MGNKRQDRRGRFGFCSQLVDFSGEVMNCLFNRHLSHLAILLPVLSVPP